MKKGFSICYRRERFSLVWECFCGLFYINSDTFVFNPTVFICYSATWVISARGGKCPFKFGVNGKIFVPLYPSSILIFFSLLRLSLLLQILPLGGLSHGYFIKNLRLWSDLVLHLVHFRHLPALHKS